MKHARDTMFGSPKKSGIFLGKVWGDLQLSMMRNCEAFGRNCRGFSCRKTIHLECNGCNDVNVEYMFFTYNLLRAQRKGPTEHVLRQKKAAPMCTIPRFWSGYGGIFESIGAMWIEIFQRQFSWVVLWGQSLGQWMHEAQFVLSNGAWMISSDAKAPRLILARCVVEWVLWNPSTSDSAEGAEQNSA